MMPTQPTPQQPVLQSLRDVSDILVATASPNQPQTVFVQLEEGVDEDSTIQVIYDVKDMIQKGVKSYRELVPGYVIENILCITPDGKVPSQTIDHIKMFPERDTEIAVMVIDADNHFTEKMANVPLLKQVRLISETIQFLNFSSVCLLRTDTFPDATLEEIEESCKHSKNTTFMKIAV